MIIALDSWLLPAIAAASSSYLVALAWERVRPQTAPVALVSAFVAGLSFIMGAICAYYRDTMLSVSIENNIIVMFLAAAITTYIWLLLRRYGSRGRK